MRCPTLLCCCFALFAAGCAAKEPAVLLTCDATTQATFDHLVPLPVSITPTGSQICLPESLAIEVDPPTPELLAVGERLAEHLRPATGFAWPVTAPTANASKITLTARGDFSLGDEGYALAIHEFGVTLSAASPAGLVHGIQTLRQLLPAAIEVPTVQSRAWPLPTGTIHDYPRFAWRGALLDVARHFFTVAEVKQFIDAMAYYKLNRLHLHLTDDQGWRIDIPKWPNLTAIGGSTEVGGATGNFFYSQAEYADLVAYAQARAIVVVPEIDMPGHSNAALASIPDLNCSGIAPDLYTGTNVGFSSLCIGRAETALFVTAVLAQIAGLTTGGYLHIGGDEAKSTPPTDYAQFVHDLQPVVVWTGKQLIGWADIAHADLTPDAIAQHWNPYDLASVQLAVQKGMKVILSPANRVYLDMKYDADTQLGQVWAGLVDEQQAYAWDPATEIAGVGEPDILGVEAALWTETVVTLAEVWEMTFPRLAGVAEIGWSAAGTNAWEAYKLRITAHGPRLTAMGIGFHRSANIPWL